MNRMTTTKALKTRSEVEKHYSIILFEFEQGFNEGPILVILGLNCLKSCFYLPQTSIIAHNLILLSQISLYSEEYS